MKIAVYHNLPSGGGKRALYEQVRRLSQRHSLDVYTLSCAEHAFCDLRPFARGHYVFPFEPFPLARRPFGRLNQGIRAADLVRLRGAQRAIAALIDAAGHDVVFVANCQFSAAPAVLQFLRTPSVYYCGEPPRLIYEPPLPRSYAEFSRWQRLGNLLDPLPGLYARTLKAQDRTSALRATAVLVNSHYSRETFFRTYGVFARVGYLGVDTELFRPLGTDADQYVLSVGALNPRKGFDFLIESLGTLPPSSRPRLILVSNMAFEPERVHLAQLAQHAGVELVFRQGISDEELVALYNRALCTTYAPVMEPFGFVPLESMACATPVVGVREAGVRETVRHGETGLLTDRDPIAFAEAVLQVRGDRSLRERLGQQGRAYVQAQWTWERSVERLEKHLAAAADGRPHAS